MLIQVYSIIKHRTAQSKCMQFSMQNDPKWMQKHVFKHVWFYKIAFNKLIWKYKNKTEHTNE